MDRLIATNSVSAGAADVAPATGTPQFATSGNPATATPATVLPAYAFNAIQEELIAIIAGAGITADKTNNAQVVKAIRALIKQSMILTDTGAANAYTAVNPTPFVAGTLVHGVQQTVQFVHANTGASTYAPDGLAVKPIYGLGLTALQGSEIPANGVGNMIYIIDAALNGGNGAWILIECTGGALQLPSGSYGVTPAQFDNSTKLATTAYVQLMAGFRNTQVFNASGTFTVPAGVTKVFVEVWGGGGGGGRGSVMGSSGGGGGAGGYGKGFYTVTPAQAVVVTVGAAGGGQATTGQIYGGSGATSSFGAFLSCTGGAGGGNYEVAAKGGVGGSPSGNNAGGWKGQDGCGGVYNSGSAAACGGIGGGQAGGAGGCGDGTANHGYTPSDGGMGSGGGGGGTSAGTASPSGANGGAGQIIVWW